VTRPEELDARGRRLRAALTAVLVRDDAPDLRLMRRWLDSWRGIGLAVVGMAHQGCQVSLGEHGAGQWIAVFYHGRGGHDPVAAAARRRSRRRGGRCSGRRGGR
jgi:hypothetical protein